MMQSKRVNGENDKLDKVEMLHAKNLKRVKVNYTGKTTVHWFNGEVKKVDVNYTEE